jgi:hypothetical protein
MFRFEPVIRHKKLPQTEHIFENRSKVPKVDDFSLDIL